MSEVFLDTSYLLALSSPRDRHHDKALRLASEFVTTRARLVTTEAVLLEIGNALSKRHFRSRAVALLKQLQQDPDVEIETLEDDLLTDALDLFERYADKDWGLTDCIWFVVMRRRGLYEAVTSDHHFRQAGFRVLLADS